MGTNILIVDDEPGIRSSVQGVLEDEGYRVNSFAGGEEVLSFLDREEADVVLLDVVLQGMNGLETLKKIRENRPRIKVIMMSGRADIATAVSATKLGAHNFFEKPLNMDQLLLALRNLDAQIAMEKRVQSLEHLVGWEMEMVGSSEPMLELRKAIARAAPTEGRVLITGENGTGKELVARAIHQESMRKNGPFVSLNCAALPRDLVESELFGYEKGAFSGALKQKPGRIENANGGTLFLDEIGDMGLETQAKLLRVLEENEAVRLGGGKPYHFDVRVISATNKELFKEIEAGRFREDLYYRLNVIPLNVVPLRERKEDIPGLADHFLLHICGKTGKGMKSWGRGAMDVLRAYDWPGNVRELKNFVERLVIMSEKESISASEMSSILAPLNVPDKTAIEEGEGLSFRELVERFEKRLLIQGLKQTNGNASELARMLKIDRAFLHKKLKEYGIK